MPHPAIDPRTKASAERDANRVLNSYRPDRSAAGAILKERLRLAELTDASEPVKEAYRHALWLLN